MKVIFLYILSVKNQLIILGLVFLFKFLVFINLLPDEGYFLSLLNDLFSKYGIGAVGIASFLENIIGVGSYAPGSIVILTAMALTAGNLKQAFLTFSFIVLPSTIAHIINFFLGKRISKYIKFQKRNIYFFLLTTLWHPHFAAVATFTLGSQKLTFLQFLYYFIPIHLLWNLFWGITMYNIGKLGIESYSFFNLFYGYMAVWIIWDLLKYYRETKKK